MRQAQLEHRAHKEFRGLQALRAQLEHRAYKEFRGLREQLEHRAYKEFRGLREQLEQLEHRVHKEFRGLLDPQAYVANAHQFLARQELQGLRVESDRRDPPDHVD